MTEDKRVKQHAKAAMAVMNSTVSAVVIINPDKTIHVMVPSGDDMDRYFAEHGGDPGDIGGPTAMALMAAKVFEQTPESNEIFHKLVGMVEMEIYGTAPLTPDGLPN